MGEDCHVNKENNPQGRKIMTKRKDMRQLQDVKKGGEDIPELGSHKRS